MAKQVFKVGNIVKSYDFEPLEGRGDCYMIGIVTEVNDFTLKFEPIREVFDGEDVTDVQGRRIVETALPGQMYFGEWEGRIKVIAE